MHSTRSHENAPTPAGAGLEAAKRPTLGTTVKSSSPCQDKDAVKDLTRAKRKERFKALSQARAWLLPLALQSKPDAHPGGVQVYCDVDGERVTSWSGQQSVSSIAPNPAQVASTVAAPFERSETSGGDQVAPPGPRVNVVPDNSRTPRTLLDSESQPSQM